MNAVRRAWRWEPATYRQVRLFAFIGVGLPVLAGTYLLLYFGFGISNLGAAVSDGLITAVILGVAFSRKIPRQRVPTDRAR